MTTPDLYDGVLAEAYDHYLSGDRIEDLPFWRRFSAGADGAILELGCGTGRVLLPLLADGIAAEGLDGSADMLALCREKAAQQGLPEPVLHQADMAGFSLGRRYGAVFSAVGTLTLLAAPGAMAAALAAVRAHLRPGGRIGISMEGPTAAPPPAGPVVVRDVVRPTDGARFLCRLEPLAPDHPATHRFRMTNEAVAPDGTILGRQTNEIAFRRWAPEELAALLRDAGFSGVAILDETGRPASGPLPSYIATAVAA